MGELRVSVEIAADLQGPAVRLQAKPLVPEQCAHYGMADLVAVLHQRVRKLAQALAGPVQRRNRTILFGG
jgi:hypothetical protein